MELLFFTDTETTGLFPRRAKGQPPMKADDPAAPHLASIAWQLRIAETGRIAGIGLHYIRPDGWSMPQGPNSAGEANGLTDEILTAIGVPGVVVAAQLSAILSRGVTLVAHGTTYDTKIIRGFLRRHGFPDHYGVTKTFCTQMKNIGACGLKQAGSNRPKTPKLREAFAHWCPGEQQPAAHSSWNDILTLMRVYSAMKKANMDLTPNSPRVSESEEDDELPGAAPQVALPLDSPVVLTPKEELKPQPAPAPEPSNFTLF